MSVIVSAEKAVQRKNEQAKKPERKKAQKAEK